MDHLPCEILVKILKYLPLISLLKARAVCKRWHHAVELHVRLHSLAICQSENTSNRKWSFTYEPVNLTHMIAGWYSNGYNLSQPIYKNLRELYICTRLIPHQMNITMAISNQLQQLRRLEIIGLFIGVNKTIRLPKLVYLNLENVTFDRITLDCEALTHLRIYRREEVGCTLDFGQITIEHPHSIRHLELSSYHPMVKTLCNLEYLLCETGDSGDGGYQWIDLKEELPKLTEFHCNQRLRSNGLLYSLQEQCKRLPDRELKIFYFGVNVFGELENRRFRTVDTQLLCDYPDRLARFLPFFLKLEYDVMESCFDPIPRDLLDKLVNLSVIEVNAKVQNVRQLIDLLKCNRYLNTLRLVNASMKQKFMNILPKLLPNLVILDVLDDAKSYEFSFALRLKNLVTVETRQRLDLDLLYKWFRKNAGLKEVHFAHLQRPFYVVRQNGTYKFNADADMSDDYPESTANDDERPDGLNRNFDTLEEMFDKLQFYRTADYYLLEARERAPVQPDPDSDAEDDAVYDLGEFAGDHSDVEQSEHDDQQGEHGDQQHEAEGSVVLTDDDDDHSDRIVMIEID